MNGCFHGNTVVHSRELVIDRCTLCGDYLVWCVNPKHENGQRHWHKADTAHDAVTLAEWKGRAGIRPEVAK